MGSPNNWRGWWRQSTHAVRLMVTSAAGLLAAAAVVGGNGTNLGTGILALATTAFVFVGLMSHHPVWRYIGAGMGAICACAAGWSWLSNIEGTGLDIMYVLRFAGIVVGIAFLFGLLVAVPCWIAWLIWQERRRR